MPVHSHIAAKRPGLALLLFLTGAQALAGQTGLPAPEKAAENFPLSLQGFFGQGDTAEAGLRLRDTGKSAWVKPGDSFAGWKLESVSTDTGVAILASGSRRVSLRLAGESGGAAPATATGRKYTSGMDSIIMRRSSMALFKHKDAMNAAIRANNEHTMELLALARPELVDPKTGKIEWTSPAFQRAWKELEVQQFMRDQTRKFLTESTEPGIVATRDGGLAYLDAEERVKPRDEDGADLPAATPEERERNKDMAHHLRVLEEADRLYLSRGGNPDTAEFDKMWKEREARQKAEEEAEAKAAAKEQPAAEPAK